MKGKGSLKKTLNRFYKEYNFEERLCHDPIEFPHRYSDPQDKEVAGFVAACFAYGKIGLFKPVIEKILSPCGGHPAAYFTNFTLRNNSRDFKDIRYRFNTEKDTLCFLSMLSQTLRKWGSLKKLFLHYYRPDHHDIRDALEGFVNYFLTIDTRPVYRNNIKPPGLTQLFPVPSKGSACKRMNLFLRWMVRKKDIDLGVWQNIPPSKLIIPLDTHIARISRCLGLTDRTASDWTTAREITDSLRNFDTEDPLKYDFALCHQGISGLCKGEKSVESCSCCTFFTA